MQLYAKGIHVFVWKKCKRTVLGVNSQTVLLREQTWVLLDFSEIQMAIITQRASKIRLFLIYQQLSDAFNTTTQPKISGPHKQKQPYGTKCFFFFKLIPSQCSYDSPEWFASF